MNEINTHDKNKTPVNTPTTENKSVPNLSDSHSSSNIFSSSNSTMIGKPSVTSHATRATFESDQLYVNLEPPGAGHGLGGITTSVSQPVLSQTNGTTGAPDFVAINNEKEKNLKTN